MHDLEGLFCKTGILRIMLNSQQEKNMHEPNLTIPIEERPGGLLTLGLGPVGGEEAGQIWAWRKKWRRARDDRVNGHERASNLGLRAFLEDGWWWRWCFRRR